MTEQNGSKKEMPSLMLTKDQSNGQGQIKWNGSYGKFLAHRLLTQAMDPIRSTTLDPISLAKLGSLLLKSTEIIGIEMSQSKKQCKESVDLKDKDGE
jgi:hypothetical protein